MGVNSNSKRKNISKQSVGLRGKFDLFSNELLKYMDLRGIQNKRERDKTTRKERM
jgi:hypothetical protein